MAITIIQEGGLLQALGIYNASIRVNVGGKNIQMNQAFFVPSGGFSPGPTLGEMAKTIQTAIDAVMQPICTIETDFVDTQVHQLIPALAKPLAGIATSDSTGSHANPTSERTSGLVITKQSLISGRSGRGRMYLPPPSTSDVTNFGTPLADYVTRATAFYTALFGVTSVTAVAGSATLVTVIWNRKTGGFATQSSFRVNSKFGTQRRRGYYKVSRHKKKA